jgi:hypothetical protein
MSSQPTQPAEGGRSAEDEGRSFTRGIGSMVAPAGDVVPAEDDEAASPPRPTFTARTSEPLVVVPEPAPGPDDTVIDPVEDTVVDPVADTAVDTAEPETAVPSAPVPEPALGPDDASVDDASVDDDRMARPSPVTAGLDEPLLADAAGLHARWLRVQAGFVDDPSEAVGDAADLIEQTAQAMVGALRQRQRELRVLWEHGPAGDVTSGEPAAVPGGDTEHLRQMMQRYRALFNQLCRP